MVSPTTHPENFPAAEIRIPSPPKTTHFACLPIQRKPKKSLLCSAGASFGVALNGLPLDPGTAEFWHNDPNWNYEAMSGKMDLGLDENNAHVQPNGAYHYHGLPMD